MNNHNQEKVWDAISEQWYHFRQKPFGDVKEVFRGILEHWKPGKILDIGCGNCRNLLSFAKFGFKCNGIDFSGEMLKQARNFADKYGFNVNLKKADAKKLPFKDNSFDYALSVAVLHHLKKDDQSKALKEMKRVLKNNGHALITVWNKMQPKLLMKSKEQYVPWHIKDKIYQRYYYLFTYIELKELLKREFKVIYSGSPLNKNLIFIVQK